MPFCRVSTTVSDTFGLALLAALISILGILALLATIFHE
jgi:hypothetical protein